MPEWVTFDNITRALFIIGYVVVGYFFFRIINNQQGTIKSQKTQLDFHEKSSNLLQERLEKSFELDKKDLNRIIKDKERTIEETECLNVDMMMDISKVFLPRITAAKDFEYTKEVVQKIESDALRKYCLDMTKKAEKNYQEYLERPL